MDNAIVTQSIEVQNQTDMIQSLIDTYTSNNTDDPCHLMPQIDFPPGTSADLLSATVDDRFAKPLWYIPQVRTAFTAGRPSTVAPVLCLSAPVVRRALHKSVAGLLRLQGYHGKCVSGNVIFLCHIQYLSLSYPASRIHAHRTQRPGRRRRRVHALVHGRYR